MGQHIAEVLRGLEGSGGIDYQPFAQFVAMYGDAAIEKQGRLLAHVLRDADDRSSILDVGSGYGLNLLLLRSIGFKTATGIEIVQSIHRKAAELIDAAGTLGVESYLGDAAHTPFGSEKFANILAVEVISHVPSLDRFLREANRILRPGGRLFVIDGNNLRCPQRAAELRRAWKVVREDERGKRRAFLTSEFPQLDRDAAATLLLHTELLGKDDTRAAVSEYIRSGRLPMALQQEEGPPMFFETGIWNEFPFDPVRLTRDFEGYGFRAKASIYVGAARGRHWQLVEELVNLLPDALRFLLRPTFVLRAVKTGEPRYLTS